MDREASMTTPKYFLVASYFRADIYLNQKERLILSAGE